MSAIGKLINLNGIQTSGLNFEILDFVFGRNCILLDNLNLVFGIGPNIPCPLLGFQYETPEFIELLNFSYSEYPFLDRTALINAYMKNNTRFKFKAYRAITTENSFVINYALNEAIYKILDNYVLNGGTFRVVTAWGSFSNLLLEKFSGFRNSDTDIGGQGFQFEFVRVNMQTQEIQEKTNTYLSNIDSGVSK